MKKHSRTAQSAHRCGVVALLGRPNAGKSSLLNAALGEKLAITAARAQTTRGRILGVLSRPGSQILFHDTPGVHRGQAKFNLAMNERALLSAEDADLRVLLFECGATWDVPEERLAELKSPILLLHTKRDLAQPSPVPALDRFVAVLEVSERDPNSVAAFLDKVVALLPEGPALYPEDFLTDAPMRFLAAEQIREVVFEQFRDEIPYSVAVEVEGWDESSKEVRIRANLLVERESQKGIVVGAGGAMLKSLGIESRKRLAPLVGKTVHLNLWVKTDHNWTKKPARARALGYL
ncbi:MAG: GTPase Era [bacterium]|nr:GTPase Era [bacterium]